MNPLEKRLGARAAATARRLLALWTALHDPAHPLTRGDFLEAATGLLGASVTDAEVVGFLLARDLLEETTSAAVILSASSLTPRAGTVANAVRLEGSVGTILAGAVEDGPMRLRRLAEGETFSAAQDAISQVIRGETSIIGWTRSLDSGGCELCRWWWREGQVWPSDHAMPRHTGCRCHQHPVTSADDTITAYGRTYVS